MAFSSPAGISRKLVLAWAVFACAVTSSAVARADEAFLCGPSRIVYVKPGELELKKKTDPCIAEYFGLKVVEQAQAQAEPKAALKPESRHTRTIRNIKAVAALRQLGPPERAEVSTYAAEKPERTAALFPPEAAPGL